MPVLLAAGACGLLVLAAYAGTAVLALAAIGLQTLLAYGLTGARDLPSPARSCALIALAGALAVVALRYAEPDPAGPTITPVVWVLGPAVVVALLLQLVRRDGRERLVELIATTVSGVALAGMLALLVPLEELPPLRETSVGLAAGGALLGVTAWWLATAGVGRWRWALRALGLVLVIAAGVALASAHIPALSSTDRTAMGVAVSVAGFVGAGAGSRLGENAASRALLMPTMALALSGPAAYLTARVLFW